MPPTRPHRLLLPFCTAALTVRLLTGCAEGPGPKGHISFAAAQRIMGPASIEGIPDVATIRQQTGQPTRFEMKEEATGKKMTVVVPPDVSLPANLPSASYVSVSGSYDKAKQQFTATAVATKVPTREQQPRG